MPVIVESRLGFGIFGLSGFAPVYLGSLNRRGYPRQTSEEFWMVIAALVVGTSTESPEPVFRYRPYDTSALILVLALY